MKKGRFTEEQIIGILKQHEAGRKVPELAREIGVSAAAIYTWKSKYGGMDVSDLGHEYASGSARSTARIHRRSNGHVMQMRLAVPLCGCSKIKKAAETPPP